MARLLEGAPVAEALAEIMKEKAASLREAGVVPTLAVVRIGSDPAAESYGAGLAKRAAGLGLRVESRVFSAGTTQETLEKAIRSLNRSGRIHGILLMRPVPAGIDELKLCRLIDPDKDVDGAGLVSLGGVFTGEKETGFPPSTAQAALEVLRYYGIGLSGKRVLVIGRSLVVGRPAAMLLLREDATVTVAHSRSEDLPALTREAGIVITAVGKPEFLTGDYFGEGQILVDVGVSWSPEKGKLCGDLCFEEAEKKAAALTPVPGGVGTVTSAVLLSHVVEAALRAEAKRTNGQNA